MKNIDADYRFVSPEEEELATAFVRDGYVIRPVENVEALQSIRNLIVKTCAEYLTVSAVSDSEQFLNNIHTRISIERLNDLRLYVFNQTNEVSWLRAAYYALAESLLHALAGNELVMQRKINLSIQMPQDDSSLLPIHADVMDGDSPFEIVCWTPYVDCYDTKSMYILNPRKNSKIQGRMANFQGKGAGELTKVLSDSLEYLFVPFGHVLLFNQTLLHGNVVNQESETRWSSNCRYKSVFSPYADKRLGEFFEPITLKPVTQIGMQFRLPSGFDE